MPGARCARSLVCSGKKHTSVVTTVTPESPGIPRAMVLRVPSCSPRCAKPVSHRRHRHWVPGPHDFTVRLNAIRQRRIRVHRIPPRVRDDREPPLQWDETESQ
jgi:hypothetical protein